ncbi:MAG TPA: tetratricopeptide repeat protein, partial [Bacteroidia bacterium]|nr:tetratricopeptide repeat protein [Bacteroidia bacterium]
MRKNFITFLFCLFCVNLIIAQEADSLKLKEMIGVIESIYRAKRDTAIVLLNQMEKKLNKLKLKNSESRTKLEFEFYSLAATVYHENGKLIEARRYYDLMLERTIKLKDTINTAAVNYCMGMLNHQEGNIPMAIKCYSIALETYELKKDQSNVALQWYSLAQVYGEQNDSLKEVEYYKKS